MAVTPALADLNTQNVSASTGRQVLASLDEIDKPGLRRSVFALPTDARLHVHAVGAADRKGKEYLAYAWILDLKSRRTVWTMDDAPGEYDHDTDNWVSDEDLSLPAGSYGVYFSAFGGRYAIDSDVNFFGWKIGKIESDSGPPREWDDIGDPDDWGVWISAEKGYRAGTVPLETPEPFPNAPVRLLGLRDHAHERVGLDLTRPVRFHLFATGEYSDAAHAFADVSWIVDRASWKKVWELSKANTTSAGGAKKNRLADETILLPKGNYVVSAVTDDSHATDKWNLAPPYDPDAWGIALEPVSLSDLDAIRVERHLEFPDPVVEIDHMGSNEAECRPFRVHQRGPILVRALGEQTGDFYADFGTIENRRTLNAVWSQDSVPSYPAGGDVKNRSIETVVTLDAGLYNLCYQTDDSHAYDDWNADPPAEPERWGISVTDVSGRTPANVTVDLEKEEFPMISLAPVGSDQHLVKRFQSDGQTKVRIIALGEGAHQEMVDYGWLENLDTGRVVWQMEYGETEWAGGAKKNREERVTLSLEDGRYALHYQTDGSHAWEDWNQSPPRQPHLWGITLIEIEDGK